MRSRQTLCLRMPQMAVWYWGMDSQSGIPGSPAPEHQIGSQLPTTESTLTGDYRWGINLKTKQSFEGLRNIIEVKLPDCCPKLCGSVSPRGGNWYYCGRCYWVLESRISTLCNHFCHHFCYFWVRNQILPSPLKAEASGAIHVSKNGSSMHCPPFLVTHFWIRSQVCVCICVCVCVCVCVGGIRESEPR